MNSKFVGCENVCNYPRIIIKDKGSKSDCNLVIVNQKRKSLNIVKIDDCVIKDGERCDFLVLNGNNIVFTEEIYVELKGSDVKKAISQLESTINQVSYDKKLLIKRCFIIVRSHCPKTTGELQVTQGRFKKNYNSSLLVREHFFECIVD